MSEKKLNQVYLQLHYHIKDKISIHREDSFFFPCYSEEEEKNVYKHLRNVMKKYPDSYIYIQRVEENGRFKNGYRISDFINVRMFRKLPNYEGDEIIEVLDWDETKKSYEKTLLISFNKFIQALKNEIELQKHWIKEN